VVQTATVRLNDTATDFSGANKLELDDGVAATLEVGLGVESVSWSARGRPRHRPLSGDFGFRQSGPVGARAVEAVATNADATSLGSFEVGVRARAWPCCSTRMARRRSRSTSRAAVARARRRRLRRDGRRDPGPLQHHRRTSASPRTIEIDGISATLRWAWGL
jgi:hypothetical protein